MKRLQKIFAAIRELSAEPSPAQAIRDAWAIVDAHVRDDQPERRAAIKLIDRIIAAVVGIAEDAEKKKATDA